MKKFILGLVFILFYPISVISQITYELAFPNINFTFPVEIQTSPDASDRMFVVEQNGTIKVFPRLENVNSNEVKTFLDISNKVHFVSGQEMGLLGLAFHPNYANNGYFYVYYTATSSLPNVRVKVVLSRFSVSNDMDIANANSELILFEFDKNQSNSNHNGGKIAFGTDGYLYMSFGDGGGGNDPEGNAQNNTNIFGTICRIDVDLDGNNPLETNANLPNGNYEIPSDNPFVGSEGLDEIFAYGIRNTWKFSIDNVTGTIWGADVGQRSFEEINIIKKGLNYGWSRFEAYNVVNGGVNITEPTEPPVFFYDSRLEGNNSITGGYVYRGSEITSLNPDISGKYIFGDFVSGRIWCLNYNATTGASTSTLLFKTDGESVSSFGLDKNGELYFSDYGIDVKLYKLVDGTTTSSAVAVNGIGKWESLLEGTDGEVNAVETSTNGNVYFGGNFSNAGNITTNDIAVWNELVGWQTLGSGTDGSVNALKIDSNGNVYIGGAFNEVNGVAAKNIAVYNGTSWSALTSGVDGSIAALEVDLNGNLFVGGAFETVNSITARNIAMWNGTSWSELRDATTSLSGTNNEVRSLAIGQDGVLYVGGNFDEAGGKTANRIATWQNGNWGTLGSGTSGFVQAIATTSNDIFIGGNFAIAGGSTVNRIARWNKTSNTYFSLGNGVSNLVNSLIHDGSNLYAAGTFDNCNIDENNSIMVNNIASWNETNGWQALGTNTSTGVDLKVNSMVFAKDDDSIDKIFVGGNFGTSGTVNSNNVSKWISNNLLSLNNDYNNKNFTIYPNPTDDKVYLSSLSEWTLFNVLGKTLKQGKSKLLSLSNLPSGLYFLKVKNQGTFKIIKK
mgnify:CR=1 FL=1|tara:strand:- start:18527 stop:21058 length:2532 start_codon:yes stop_codon:yes gene_type:complete